MSKDFLRQHVTSVPNSFVNLNKITSGEPMVVAKELSRIRAVREQALQKEEQEKIAKEQLFLQLELTKASKKAFLKTSEEWQKIFQEKEIIRLEQEKILQEKEAMRVATEKILHEQALLQEERVKIAATQEALKLEQESLGTKNDQGNVQEDVDELSVPLLIEITQETPILDLESNSPDSSNLSDISDLLFESNMYQQPTIESGYVKVELFGDNQSNE